MNEAALNPAMPPPAPAPTDEQLMWRVKLEDDPHVFAQLVGRWEKALQHLGARMTGKPHWGEDLAQETFSRLFACRKSYAPTARFSTFLFRLAMNLCYDELRKTSRRPEQPLEDLGSLDPRCAPASATIRPDCSADENERAACVREALLDLAEPYRAVVVLRHYEGLKFREISEVLAIPEGTAKSRMAEALHLLHQRLGPLLGDSRNTPVPPPKNISS